LFCEWPFFFGCFGAAGFFLAMSRAIFDDGFSLRPWHGGVLVILEGLGFWHHFGQGAPGPDIDTVQLALVGHQLLSLGITVAALVQAFAGRAEDMIEARLRFRSVFVAVGGIYILIVVAVEVYLQASPADPALELVNLAAIFALAFAFAVSMTRLRPHLMPAVDRTAPVAPAPAIAGPG